MKNLIIGIVVLLILISRQSIAQRFIDYESAPIYYAKAKPENKIEEFQIQLKANKSRLVHEPKFGFLKSLLRELGISEASQVLVFSKSSLQSHFVGPKTPRAIYFNDSTFVGYVNNPSGMIEMAVADNNRGISFYTLDQSENLKPEIQLQNNQCLTCHGGPRSLGVPGLMVRSVFTDNEGRLLFSAGGNHTDHSTPLENRWGGWYVTGHSGNQKHLGNFFLKDKKRPLHPDNTKGVNLNMLDSFLDTDDYLQPGSDIVSLMVMEHQIDVLNCITRVIYEYKIGTVSNECAGLNTAVEDLVKKLLFCLEAPLTNPIKGGEAFKKYFENSSEEGTLGKTLRQLNLKNRIFKHSLSYMITSDAFGNLPPEARKKVLKRIMQIVQSDQKLQGFEHLQAADKNSIQELLKNMIITEN